MQEGSYSLSGMGGRRGLRPTRESVTVAVSSLLLVVLCALFAPSALAYGALSGSLPFAAILAIVGLGQMLVVQQGGFDLSVPGGVSLAVVLASHYPAGDDALLPTAVGRAVIRVRNIHTTCASIAAAPRRESPSSATSWKKNSEPF